ncbi:hypothetical protein L0244_35635 [bacterium]|nr:hypothetical protein [bacterium]
MDSVPERIKTKIDLIRSGLDRLTDQAFASIQTELDNPISTQFHRERSGDILTDYERAQLVSFVARYENLPELSEVTIVEIKGEHYISDMPFIRHLLNEYRSIIYNEKDSVHYKRVHRFCYEKLNLGSPLQGTKITVFHEANNAQSDITSKYVKWLCEHCEAISFILKAMEFDYIYNGVLQHSAQEHSSRFLRDYSSGELNYIFWKHAEALSIIKNLLQPYHQLVNFLCFPKLGPL